MASVLTSNSEIQQLEGKLGRQENDIDQLQTLDKLVGHHLFTDLRQAEGYLSRQYTILKDGDYPVFQLNYHLNKALVENQKYNYKLSEFHFQKSIEILEVSGHANQMAETYIDYIGTCINLEKKEDAATYLDKAAKLLKTFPDQKLKARIICRQGYLHLHNSNYPKAVEFFLEAEKNFHSLSPSSLTLKDYYFLTLVHSGLGKVYELIEDHEKSVKAYQKVIQMCETKGMRSRLSWHYLNVGNGFRTINDEKNAEKYFKKSLHTMEDISQDTRARAFANLGFCYFQKKKYKQALKLYQHAEQLFREKKEDDYYNFANIEHGRAYLFEELGAKKGTIKHLITALEFASLAYKANHISNRLKNYKQIAKISKDIAAFYAEVGDFKNAYCYQKIHEEYEKLTLEHTNKRKILELELKYNAEKKESEAELLKLQATKLQLKALRAQMNPHFVFNALNSIQHHITSKDSDSAAQYLAKFANLVRQSLENSNLEIISLEQEIEFLQVYLDINEKLRFEGRLKYEIVVDDEIEKEEDILGVPTMIVQPYVENAIEHGIRPKKSGLIKVSFSLLDEFTILCVVEDNGIGRTKASELQKKNAAQKNHRSMGTSITEKRLELLHNTKKNKELFVNTIDLKEKETGKALGTKVEIQIPIMEIHTVEEAR